MASGRQEERGKEESQENVCRHRHAKIAADSPLVRIRLTGRCGIISICSAIATVACQGRWTSVCSIIVSIIIVVSAIPGRPLKLLDLGMSQPLAEVVGDGPVVRIDRRAAAQAPCEWALYGTTAEARPARA